MSGIVSERAEAKLKSIQHELFERNVPVLLIVEGNGGSLMAQIMNRFISLLEPRGITYNHFNPYDPSTNSVFELLKAVPPKGKIAVFDRAWYSFAAVNIDRDDVYEDLAASIARLERYYCDNGIMVVKLLLDMEEDVLERYEDTYPKTFGTDCGFLGGDTIIDSDKAKAKQIRKRLSKLYKLTDTDYAPWERITVGDYDGTCIQVVRAVTARLEDIIEIGYKPKRYEIQEIYPNPRETADLTKTIDKDEYKRKIEKLQSELSLMQCKLAVSGRSMVLAFEGWDAAGKGGAIRRITSCLNPRGYKAVPIPAPTAEEKAHTHLWRFFRNVPDPGHITIFDRSWYGRMMVEPIEGFCTEEEYARAGDEINMFEELMVKGGVILIKFWVDISKDEQLNRFNARKEDPMKQWKLTDEDWRNREKWDTYESYVDSMMKQTSTPFAPWTVIEGNDKKFARIQILETIVKKLKKELD